MSDFQKIYNAIVSTGHVPRRYWCGVYERVCLGIQLTSNYELWGVAIELAENFGSAGLPIELRNPPIIDSLGRGPIAYWPNITWEDPEQDE